MTIKTATGLALILVAGSALGDCSHGAIVGGTAGAVVGDK